jgi:hypothetical protein
VSLKTRRQDAKATVRAGALGARQRARQAATQVTPLAKSARLTANRGARGARAWAAPRVERSGYAVTERVAPKVSAMMVAAARRMQPPQPARRRRWPRIVAGIVTLITGSAAAVFLLSRRGAVFAAKPDGMSQPMAASNGSAAGRHLADAETADVNGQVRTP